jgi:uncharacterized protein
MGLSKRNIEIDLIRTVALIGICVVNVPFMAMPPAAQFTPPAAVADKAALFVIEAAFQGKFFLLFSFIFGWGLHIQTLSAQRAGRSFGWRYLRRLIGLGLIGIGHAIFVFSGDILLLYSILGALIWPVQNWTIKALLRVALAMIPLALVTLALLGVSFDTSGVYQDMGNGLGGSYIEATLTRLRDWPSTFIFIVFFNGPLAFAAFALGLAAAKADFFRTDHPGYKVLIRWVPVFLAVAVPLNLLYAASLSGFIQSWPDWVEGLGFVGLAIGGPLLSAVYLVTLVSLARRYLLPARWLAAGRNSLTGYVTDGVIAGLIFGGYGLGLFGSLGYAVLLPLAIAIALLGIVIAYFWESVSARGPLESLLRVVTYAGEPKQGEDRPIKHRLD